LHLFKNGGLRYFLKKIDEGVLDLFLKIVNQIFPSLMTCLRLFNFGEKRRADVEGV
jgi:hypothetical protein